MDDTINIENLPLHLVYGVADAVIFYSDKDKQEVEAFIAKVEKEATEDRKLVVIYLYDKLIDEQPDETKNRCIEQMCMYAVLVMFNMTDNLLNDEKLLFHKNEHIMKALKNKNFIPIWVKKKRSEYDDLPYGLGQFRGVSDQDPNMVKKLTNMLELPVYKKRRAELTEKHKREKEAWVAAEKERQDTEKRRTKDVQEEMPPYLVKSMDSAEESLASLSPRPNTVYNITLHQPQIVVIGKHGVSTESGDVNVEETDTGRAEATSSSFQMSLKETNKQ